MKNPFNFSTHPNCFDGHNYALSILDGSIVSCIYVKAACQRYISDLEKCLNDFEFGYYFDFDKAEKYLRLVQKFQHVEGHWETNEIIYEPWQKFIFMNIEGFFIRASKTRKYRTAHVEIARGNGKSCVASQAALYHLRLDEPNGNHIYCVATKKEQARIVLDSARAMAEKNDSFCKKMNVDVKAHELAHSKSNSFIRALSSQKDSLDGLKAKLIITDELHAMKRETFETVDSGQSKRRDSLLLSITTAGYNTDGVGHSQSSYAKKVALGDVKDETFFAMVYTIDEGDDEFDENVWMKANPGFGTIVDPVNFKAKAMKARENPSDLNGFKIKHLNVWTNTASPFFSLTKWDECADTTLKLENFAGKKCYAAVDLASKIDLASLVYLFKDIETGIYYLFEKSYVPEETVEESRNDNYRLWVRDKWLLATPGAAINYITLAEEFVSDSKSFRFCKAHYDPWNATEFATRMTKERIEMVEFNMNTSNLSEPMKMFDALIKEGKIRHNGSPLLRWCLGNVVAKRDHNDNVFPRKEHENNKIDPIVGAMMALAGWINEEEELSVYETHGLRFV